jgi:regulator of replication initiation timing
MSDSKNGNQVENQSESVIESFKIKIENLINENSKLKLENKILKEENSTLKNKLQQVY